MRKFILLRMSRWGVDTISHPVAVADATDKLQAFVREHLGLLTTWQYIDSGHMNSDLHTDSADESKSRYWYMIRPITWVE